MVRSWSILVLCSLAWAGLAWADPLAACPEPLPPVWSIDTAVHWTLLYNPALAAVRQQHGIAAAGVVIARTYPFNPVWTNKLFADNGPESAGVTSHLAMEQRISLDLEVRRQGKYRRQAAYAALSRTDWEIAFQELTFALRVIRAFDALLYAQARLRLGEDTVRLDQQVVEQVRTLVGRGLLRPEDLVVAQSEVSSVSAALGPSRSTLQRAEQEFRLALGVMADSLPVQGTLEVPAPMEAAEALVAAALERRPDLHARQIAVAEAEARLRLAIADRYGNPNIGPDYEYNETRVNFIGAQLTLPLPLLNTHRGEIQQRKAEQARAFLDLQSTEVAVRQGVLGALNRLRNAHAWVDSYRSQILPAQEALRNQMEALFAQGRVDVLKVIDLRRKQLQARGGYLDALYEARQAQADLAAAVGDLTLALPASCAPGAETSPRSAP
jgi:cobalt-zinc-cadmium efflux system outer membrane protein